MEWISTQESMPENNQEVLCWNGQSVVFSIFQRGKDLENGHAFMIQKYPSMGDRTLVTSWVGVTHWMELPPKP